MPQFELADAAPQVVWLILVFLLLYLSMALMLPKVDKVVEDRKTRVAADLSAAEAARAAARDAVSGGDTTLSDARAEALRVTGKARDSAAASTAAKLAEADAALEARAGAATQSLQTARAAAIAELDAVAAVATVDLVNRVAGLEISNDEAAAAVRKVAA